MPYACNALYYPARKVSESYTLVILHSLHTVVPSDPLTHTGKVSEVCCPRTPQQSAQVRANPRPFNHATAHCTI